MPLHHMSVCVPEPKMEEVVAFLLSSLRHMGFREHLRPHPRFVGLGEEVPYIWIVGVGFEGMTPELTAQQLQEMHIAFSCKSVQQVRQFHAAGLRAGGTDNGGPGHRPEYHPGYYGAFVRDPACGINFEVVFNACPTDADELRAVEEEADANLRRDG